MKITNILKHLISTISILAIVVGCTKVLQDGNLEGNNKVIKAQLPFEPSNNISRSANA